MNYRELGRSIARQIISESDFPIDFAAQSPRRTKSCRKGIPCGGSCIASKKRCTSELGELAGKLVKKVKDIKSSADNSSASSAPKQNTPTVKTNRTSAKMLRDSAIERYGEDAVKDVERKLARIMKDAELNVRIPSHAVGEILRGGLKNSFELEMTHPDDEDDDVFFERKFEESRKMGYSPDTPYTERPKYGYFYDKDKSSSQLKESATLDMYGRVMLQMKSEVKERTSFAATERWGWKPGHPSNASPLNTDKEPPPPDISGLMRKKIEIYEDENGDTRIRELDEVDWASARKTIDAILNTNNPSIRQIEKDANLAYFEAQIHGTVAPRDIEAIYAPKNERISDADMDLAKQLGIPIYYLP